MLLPIFWFFERIVAVIWSSLTKLFGFGSQSKKRPLIYFLAALGPMLLIDLSSCIGTDSVAFHLSLVVEAILLEVVGLAYLTKK